MLDCSESGLVKQWCFRAFGGTPHTEDSKNANLTKLDWLDLRWWKCELY